MNAPMKKPIRILMTLLALTLFIVGTAKANTTIEFASLSPDGLISFSGGNFVFTHSTSDFSVVHSLPFDTLHNFTGLIGGTYAIGDISLGGLGLIASVTPVVGGGANTFTINDGATPFTANIQWVKISTAVNGALGGLNQELQMNLSGFSYAGTNQELLALLADFQGTSTLSWQFATSGFDLNALKAASSSNRVETSYSGSINSVPIPPTALLLGSGLLGMITLGRRWKRKQA
jgi:hypothetical protein